VGVCPGDKTFVVTVDDGALNGYANGAPIWEAHGFRASFAIVTGKVGDYLMDPPPAWYSPDKPHFSWAQAQDLLDRGFGIDNHTVFHTPVANDSPSLLDKEVQAAQNDITNHLGITPSVFVYPYGSYGTGEQSYLAARFDLAFTTRGGALEDPADPMHSPRLRVSRSTTPGDLLKRMSSFAHPCVTP
jgi:peptidoglycan/xylan/chitin deacetylase (PgdA/CDA1 family)